MLKIRKLLLLITMLVSQSAFCQDAQKPTELNISNNDRCFYFSSMDWYDIVIAYDEAKNIIGKIDVKREARNTQSQLICEPFDYVYDNYRYFVFKHKKEIKIVYFNPDTQEYYYITQKEFEDVQK